MVHQVLRQLVSGDHTVGAQLLDHVVGHLEGHLVGHVKALLGEMPLDGVQNQRIPLGLGQAQRIGQRIGNLPHHLAVFTVLQILYAQHVGHQTNRQRLQLLRHRAETLIGLQLLHHIRQKPALAHFLRHVVVIDVLAEQTVNLEVTHHVQKQVNVLLQSLGGLGGQDLQESGNGGVDGGIQGGAGNPCEGLILQPGLGQGHQGIGSHHTDPIRLKEAVGGIKQKLLVRIGVVSLVQGLGGIQHMGGRHDHAAQLILQIDLYHLTVGLGGIQLSRGQSRKDGISHRAVNNGHHGMMAKGIRQGHYVLRGHILGQSLLYGGGIQYPALLHGVYQMGTEGQIAAQRNQHHHDDEQTVKGAHRHGDPPQRGAAQEGDAGPHDQQDQAQKPAQDQEHKQIQNGGDHQRHQHPRPLSACGNAVQNRRDLLRQSGEQDRIDHVRHGFSQIAGQGNGGEDGDQCHAQAHHRQHPAPLTSLQHMDQGKHDHIQRSDQGYEQGYRHGTDLPKHIYGYYSTFFLGCQWEFGPSPKESKKFQLFLKNLLTNPSCCAIISPFR